MNDPITLEKLDAKLSELLTTVKEGFEKTATKTELKTVEAELRTEFDEKIEMILLTVKEGFDETASKAELAVVKTDLAVVKTDLATVRSELRTVQATMVTKNYLDEKLANLKSDLIRIIRTLDSKIEYLISVLENRKIISGDEVKHMHSSFQIFPTLPETTF